MSHSLLEGFASFFYYESVEHIGWLLVHSTWQFAILAGVAFALDQFLRRHSASARYLNFACVLALMVIAPFATLLVIPRQAASPAIVVAEVEVSRPTPLEDTNEAATVAGLAEMAILDLPLIENAPLGEERSAANAGFSTRSTPSWSRASNALRPWLSTIVALWSLGVLAFSVRPLLSWHTVRRLRRVGIATVEESIQRSLVQLKQTLVVRRSVEVFQSTLVHAPVVVGCFRSVILLPVSLLANLPAEQLRSILAHELAHVRRYDYLVNLLQTLVETLFFFHPAIWWVSHRMRVERENCCDDIVVAVLGDRVQYGRALLAIEEHRGAASVLALGARDGSLLSRIERISGLAKGRSQTRVGGMAGLLSLALALAGVMWGMAAGYSGAEDTAQAGLDTATSAESDAPFRLPDHWIVEDVRYVNGGAEIVTVSVQGGVNVRRWDVAGRKLISEIKLSADQHGRPVRYETLQLSANGQRVVAATDAYVGVWDSRTGELLHRLPIPQKEWAYDCVRCLDCSPDATTIVAGLGTSFDKTTLIYDGFGIIWDVATGEVKQMLTHARGFYFADISLSSDGHRFVTVNERGTTVCIWDVSSGELLHDLSDEIWDWKSPEPDIVKNNIVKAVAFSPDNRMAAVSGTFGTKLFDAESGKLLRTIDATYGYYNGKGLAFSPDGTQLARFGCGDRAGGYSVPIWSTESGERLFEFATESSAGAFSNDGSALAVVDSDFYEALSVWPLSGEMNKSFAAPPTKSAHVDEVEANTHYRGAKASALIDKWKPQWGEPQHGLQYGVALTVDSNQFRVGQRVVMAAFLRNASDKTLQFAAQPDMFGNLPAVTSAAGELIPLKSRPLVGGVVGDYRDTLEPGEAFGPLYLNFGLGANPRPGLQTWEPFCPNPPAGSYSLTHTIPFKVSPPGTSSNLTDPLWTSGTLTSHRLDFEVLDAEPSNQVNQTPAIPTTADAAKLLPDFLNVMAVRFSPDSSSLWSVATKSEVSIRQWDIATEKKTHEAKLQGGKHGNFFLSSELTLSQDGTRVVGIVDRGIGIWDTATGELVKRLEPSDGLKNCSLKGLSVTDDFSRIASGSQPGFSGFGTPDALGIVWDVASGEVLQTVTHLKAVQIHCTALSPDGKWLATGAQNPTLCIWDVATGQLVREIANDNAGRKHTDPKVELVPASQVLRLQFSPDGKILAMADMLGVKMFDTDSGAVLHEIDKPFRFGRSGLVFSPDGQMLARVATDDLVHIWSTKSAELLAELATEAHQGSFSNDGQWFAVGFSDKAFGIGVWRLSKPAGAILEDSPDAEPKENSREAKVSEAFDRESWMKAWREFYAEQNIADRQFVRNAYIDLTGKPAPADVVTAFEDERSPRKGEELVERLVASEGFERFQRSLIRERQASGEGEDSVLRRILRGPQAQAHVERSDVAWGVQRNGIQVGIRVRGTPVPLRNGQRVPLDVFIRNTAEEINTLDLTFDFIAMVPNVVDPSGNLVPIEAFSLRGANALYRETLRPGDVFVYPHIGLGIGENPTPGKNWNPHTPRLKAGKYRVAQSVQEWETGEITFEVRADPQSPNND